MAKTYICKECGEVIRERAVPQCLVEINLCAECWARHANRGTLLDKIAKLPLITEVNLGKETNG